MQSNEFLNTVEMSFLPEERQSLNNALNGKRGGLSCWLFGSPKNNFAQYAVIGTLSYKRALLAEADLDVRSYTPATPVVPYKDVRGRQVQAAATFVLHKPEGLVWESVVDVEQEHRLSELAREALREAAGRVGASYRIITERDFEWRDRKTGAMRNRDIEVENWGVLVPAMFRARPTKFILDFEMDTLTRMLQAHSKVSVADLLYEPKVDEGRMLAVIGLSLQKGLVHTDLKNRVFSLESSLTWANRNIESPTGLNVVL